MRYLVAENFVIVLVEIQYTPNVTNSYVLKQFQIFAGIRHLAVKVSRWKLDAWFSANFPQDVFGIVVYCFIISKVVVFDVTRSTHVVLWSPMVVDLSFVLNFPQNVANKLVECHVPCKFWQTGNKHNSDISTRIILHHITFSGKHWSFTLRAYLRKFVHICCVHTCSL